MIMLPLILVYSMNILCFALSVNQTINLNKEITHLHAITANSKKEIEEIKKNLMETYINVHN